MFDVITNGSATIDCFVDTGKQLFHTLHKDHGEIVYVPFGSKINVENMDFTTGGGGTNTAVCFARLGLQVAYLGKLGGDQAHMIFKELQNEGVSTELIAKGKDVGFSVILDAKGKDRTILTHKGSNNLLSMGDIKKSLLKTKWFYMASMMGKSFETQIKLANFAEQRKIKIAFNPSSYLAKQGYKAVLPILRHTNVLIVNKEEAGELLGKKLPVEDMLKKLKKLIKDTVIITDGKNGCYCYADKYYYIQSSGQEPVETTGAGDSFGSSFIAGQIMGHDVECCLRMGQANAESVIMHHGAKNNLLSLKELTKKVKALKSPLTTKMI